VIRAVLFDLFDTLLYLNAPVLAGARRGMALHAGVDPDIWAALWRENVRDRMLGRLGRLEDELRTMLRQVGMMDPSPALLRNLAEREVAGWASAVTLYPETLPTLTALQVRRLKVGLVSNCSAHGDVLARIGLAPHFDAITLSCEIGVMKPDPAIYQHAARALGVPLTESMFVADGAFTELDAAQALGMVAVKIEQAHQSGDYGTSTAFDHRIERLDEVLTLLKQHRPLDRPPDNPFPCQPLPDR
jgi:putative hydrolase of the HAD superfamily